MSFVLSGFADEIATSFAEQIAEVKKLGMDYVELRFVDGINFADLGVEKFIELKNKLKRNNIKASSIGSPIGKAELNDDFEKQLKTAEKIFSFARDLECGYVRIFSFYTKEKSHVQCKNSVIEKLKKLILLAEKYNITLCLENEENLYGESPDDCLELLDYFGGKLKMAFDMGNFRLCGYSPIKAYEKLAKYIAYFHIKDALISGEIVPCGEGDAEIEKIIRNYYEFNSNKQIFLSLEPHLVDFSGLNALAAHKLKHGRYFETPGKAFTYAMNNLRNIIKKIEQ